MTRNDCQEIVNRSPGSIRRESHEYHARFHLGGSGCERMDTCMSDAGRREGRPMDRDDSFAMFFDLVGTLGSLEETYTGGQARVLRPYPEVEAQLQRLRDGRVKIGVVST